VTNDDTHSGGRLFQSRAARDLWGVLLAVVLMTTIWVVTTGAVGDTIVGPLRSYFSGIQALDSWRPMKAAQAFLDGPHDGLVYDAMLGTRGAKFQYPLSSLLLIRGLGYGALNVISWLTVPIVMAVVWFVLRRSSQNSVWKFDSGDAMVALAVFGLTLTFYPVIKAYSLGQIQTLITVALALAFAAVAYRRDDLAGVAIGFACLIKPAYLLIALWALVRRRWSLLATMTGVILIGMTAALVAYGVADNLNYLSALSLISKRGETFFANQSFNGFLNRLMGNGDSLKFDRTSFAAFNPIVYGGTLVVFLLLVGIGLWLPRRSQRSGSTLDLGAFVVTLTITSPVAWEHHYGVVLPIFAVVAPIALTSRPLGAWTAPTLATSYALISQSLLWTNRFAGTALGVFQSYMLIGAALLLVTMYATLLRPSAVGRPLHPST
jgi:hypothetical protein